MDINTARNRRRGPAPLDATDKRRHTVSARLNDAELAELNAARGPYQRGEWLRMAGIGKLPPSIPAINRDAWAVLATVVSNLNQYQSAINQGKAHAIPAGVLDALRDQVQDLRRELIGAVVEFEEDSDEGDE